MHAFLKGDKTALSKPNRDKDSTSKTKLVPWVEKYRPKTIDDVAHQEEVVNVLKGSLQQMNLPNMLFYGPPGTGKTSTILAICRDIYGSGSLKGRVLEMNASDHRGIDVVRHKIKDFSQLAASGTRPDGKCCPPFKVVILDEADSMTNNAQAALRRLMESETKTTRFCLICNYVSRIIDPITSRCAKFRFKPLSYEILAKQLQNICAAENIQYNMEAIKALIDTSEGDMRKAITTLQSVFRMKDTDEEILADDVFEVIGVIPQETIIKLMDTCASGSYERLESYVKDMIYDGYCAGQLQDQLLDTIINDAILTDKQKAAICLRLSVGDRRLMDGADEYLQIMDISTCILQQLQNN